MTSQYFKLNRILAALIDGLVMFVILSIVCVFPTINLIRGIVEDKLLMSDLMWLFFSVFGSLCIWILYLFLGGVIFKGSTLGMKICHLYFVKSNGQVLTWMDILYREFAVVVCIVFSLGFTLIFDPISLFCSDNGKNFYDIVSSTKVVSKDELY